MKTGWWKVSFEVELDGVTVDIGELSAASRERIFKQISQGCVAGEVVDYEKKQSREP